MSFQGHWVRVQLTTIVELPVVRIITWYDGGRNGDFGAGSTD